MIRLHPEGRRDLIMDVLLREGSATIGRLAEELGVSVVTIHRDLERMERQGALARVQGGASLPAGRSQRSRFATDWEVRRGTHPEAKAAIGREARTLIQPGSTLFLDGSTTALALAVALDAAPLPVTVVTDSPAAAVAIHAPEVRVVMAPGHVDHELRMLSGGWTTEFLSRLNYNAVFVSCAAVDLKGGVTTTRREIQEILQTVIERAQDNYCLADSSKFGRMALLGIAGVGAFTAILTDDQLDPSIAAAYRSAGVRLIECATNQETPAT